MDPADSRQCARGWAGGVPLQIRELLLEHSESAAYYGTPAAWSEIVSAALWAVVAVGGALGLNVTKLLADLSSLSRLDRHDVDR